MNHQSPICPVASSPNLPSVGASDTVPLWTLLTRFRHGGLASTIYAGESEVHDALLSVFEAEIDSDTRDRAKELLAGRRFLDVQRLVGEALDATGHSFCIEAHELSLPRESWTRQKPTQPGKYLWRLPESEKRGSYILEAEVFLSGDELLIACDGETICSMNDARDCEWKPAA